MDFDINVKFWESQRNVSRYLFVIVDLYKIQIVFCCDLLFLCMCLSFKKLIAIISRVAIHCLVYIKKERELIKNIFYIKMHKSKFTQTHTDSYDAIS